MDIAPPPGTAVDQTVSDKQARKRLKNKRYRQRRKQRKIVCDIKAPPTEEIVDNNPHKISKHELQEKLRKRMSGLQNQRTGVLHQRMQKLKDSFMGSNGNVNINQFLDKMGITDPQVRDEMIKLAKSGKLQSIPAIQKYLTDFMN